VLTIDEAGLRANVIKVSGEIRAALEQQAKVQDSPQDKQQPE